MDIERILFTTTMFFLKVLLLHAYFNEDTLNGRTYDLKTIHLFCVFEQSE
jgi:hypothetical protein